MGLQESELQNICLIASRENYGEDSRYEHIHTSFYHDEALGLVEAGENTQLVQFTFNEKGLESMMDLHTFTVDCDKAKILCEKLLGSGRSFGIKESIT